MFQISEFWAGNSPFELDMNATAFVVWFKDRPRISSDGFSTIVKDFRAYNSEARWSSFCHLFTLYYKMRQLDSIYQIMI